MKGECERCECERCDCERCECERCDCDMKSSSHIAAMTYRLTTSYLRLESAPSLPFPPMQILTQPISLPLNCLQLVDR